MSNSLPIGSVLPYAGKHDYEIPQNWLLCDGRTLGQSDYPDLFAAIGIAHGAEDNESFCIPDLQGRFLRAVTGSRGADPDSAARTAPRPDLPAPYVGNGGNQVGSVQGFEIGRAHV